MNLEAKRNITKEDFLIKLHEYFEGKNNAIKEEKKYMQTFFDKNLQDHCKINKDKYLMEDIIKNNQYIKQKKADQLMIEIKEFLKQYQITNPSNQMFFCDQIYGKMTDYVYCEKDGKTIKNIKNLQKEYQNTDIDLNPTGVAINYLEKYQYIDNVTIQKESKNVTIQKAYELCRILQLEILETSENFTKIIKDLNDSKYNLKKILELIKKNYLDYRTNLSSRLICKNESERSSSQNNQDLNFWRLLTNLGHHTSIFPQKKNKITIKAKRGEIDNTKFKKEVWKALVKNPYSDNFPNKIKEIQKKLDQEAQKNKISNNQKKFLSVTKNKEEIQKKFDQRNTQYQQQYNHYKTQENNQSKIKKNRSKGKQI